MDMLSRSSVSRFCCFDFVLYYLDWLHMRLSNKGLRDIRPFKMMVRLLKMFHLHTRRKHQTYNGISFRIKDLVYRISHDLESAYIRCQSPASYVSDINSELARIEDDMRVLFEIDIEELRIMLSDYSPVGPGLEDYERLTVHVIESILQNLMDLIIEFFKYFDDIHMSIPLDGFLDNLMFLKNLIGFATLQGVERNQMIDLLIHVEAAAVNTACLICKYLFVNIHEMHYEIFKLEILIDLVNPQFRETCINVLTASKLSRPSLHTSLMEKNNYLLAAELNEKFLSYTKVLLTGNAGVGSPGEDHILKLFDGASFLSFLLGQHLIRVGVIDMWIAICSHSLDEVRDGLDKETEKVVKFIKTEVAQIYAQLPLSFPRTNELGSIDFLLENLKELAITEDNSIAFPNGHIHTVVEDLEFLKSILRNIVDKRNHCEQLQTLWNGAMGVAYKAELVIDSVMVGEKPDFLDIIARDIKLMRIKAQEVYDSRRHENEALRITKNSIDMASPLSTSALNEVLVSLADEVNTIIDRLRRGSKGLDIVSIVGMPGLGKTTLASKVYSDLSILDHFHVRGWCCVSQVYSKHSLLVQILCSVFSENADKYLEKNEDDLAEKLYKCLKRKKYVIVLDDLWHIDAWNLLKGSFPDDANGSRILVTSRSRNVPLQIKSDSEPHHLRQLTDEESFKLLRSKIFGEEGCPPTLSVIGMQIAKDCKGLPLSVVIVAGILASVEHDCWEEVANSLSSSTVIETENGIKTLDLSYRYLPDYLKPCLLYFGAFEEDQDIPVRRLVLLWISEGFVQKSEANNLETVADEYLMDLIDRNLVTVTKQRSVGGVKACKVHDLVHEFCVAKAEEESFLQILNASRELFPSSCVYNSHRLCLYSERKPEMDISRIFFPPYSRCLIFFGNSVYWKTDLSLILRKFKLLRVLDFETIRLFHIYREIELLVHLRYLVISCDTESIPSSIANLSRLETFIIICYVENVTLPETIWKMKKLRHLRVKYGRFSLPIQNLEVSPVLYQLDTFGPLSIDFSSQCSQKILSRLPNIRRLKFAGGNSNGNIELKLLHRLESLKIDRLGKYEFAFTLNLKKLTLSHYYQLWSRISSIGKLPNLEVLKLLEGAFVGETWEMKEGEFLKLKFLKLKKLEIVKWTSCDNFPHLQKLVLKHCWNLEEIPSCLEETPTIEMIEVSFCHKSAVSSVKQIQKQQMDMGNEGLKIFIRE